MSVNTILDWKITDQNEVKWYFGIRVLLLIFGQIKDSGVAFIYI